MVDSIISLALLYIRRNHNFRNNWPNFRMGIELREIQIWNQLELMQADYSAAYWNDVEKEKAKEWWVNDPTDPKLKQYLIRSGLLDQFTFISAILEEFTINRDSSRHSKINVLDVASGSGWASSLLSNFEFVETVMAVEFSLHRLDLLFEDTVANLGGDEDKIDRYLGSFYDLKLPDTSVDVVFLSQAFHHAEDPNKLLEEMNRLLKADGIIVMIGEHKFSALTHLRTFISRIVHEHRVPIRWSDLYPPDPVLGDHYYTRRQYRKFLSKFDLIGHLYYDYPSLIIVARRYQGI